MISGKHKLATIVRLYGNSCFVLIYNVWVGGCVRACVRGCVCTGLLDRLSLNMSEALRNFNDIMLKFVFSVQ